MWSDEPDENLLARGQILAGRASPNASSHLGNPVPARTLTTYLLAHGWADGKEAIVGEREEARIGQET